MLLVLSEQDESRHELPSDRQLGTSRVTTEGGPAAAMERMEGKPSSQLTILDKQLNKSLGAVFSI